MFAVFLFSLYINALPQHLVNKPLLYADDTKILGQFSEQKQLQFDINRAIKWSGLNKLNLNFDKFSILEEFSYKNKYDLSAELFANGITIQNKKTS